MESGQREKRVNNDKTHWVNFVPHSTHLLLLLSSGILLSFVLPPSFVFFLGFTLELALGEDSICLFGLALLTLEMETRWNVGEFAFESEIQLRLALLGDPSSGSCCSLMKRTQTPKATHFTANRARQSLVRSFVVYDDRLSHWILCECATRNEGTASASRQTFTWALCADSERASRRESVSSDTQNKKVRSFVSSRRLRAGASAWANKWISR